jgi:hypothetical protein
MISVDDCLLLENVMPPQVGGFYKEVNLYVINGALTKYI